MAGPVIGAAVGSAAGSIGGSLLGASSAKKLLDRQLSWQRQMYSHRYRMTMRDMRAAGLNPLLAGELGAGSAPGAPGAQALSQDFLSKGIASGVQAARAVQEQRNLRAQEKATIQSEAESRAREDDYVASVGLKSAEKAKVLETIPNIPPKMKGEIAELQTQTQLNSARALEARSAAARNEAEATRIGPYPGAQRELSRIVEEMNRSLDYKGPTALEVFKRGLRGEDNARRYPPRQGRDQ